MLGEIDSGPDLTVRLGLFLTSLWPESNFYDPLVNIYALLVL